MEKAGKPEVYTLWQKPKTDRHLQSLLKNNRIMTVLQSESGSDFGLVGFREGKGARYLAFPKSLKRFRGQRIWESNGISFKSNGMSESIIDGSASARIERWTKISRAIRGILLMPEVTIEGQRRLKAGRVLVHRRGRAWFAGHALSCRRRRRNDWPDRQRCRRYLEFAATTTSRDERHRPQKTGIGARPFARCESARGCRFARRKVSRGQRDGRSRAIRRGRRWIG